MGLILVEKNLYPIKTNIGEVLSVKNSPNVYMFFHIDNGTRLKCANITIICNTSLITFLVKGSRICQNMPRWHMD